MIKACLRWRPQAAEFRHAIITKSKLVSSVLLFSIAWLYELRGREQPTEASLKKEEPSSISPSVSWSVSPKTHRPTDIMSNKVRISRKVNCSVWEFRITHTHTHSLHCIVPTYILWLYSLTKQYEANEQKSVLLAPFQNFLGAILKD